MKLAEALQERADLNRNIEQLQSRLNNNVLVQEGEEPAEDPQKLKEMLENCKDQHQDLQKELESLLEEFHDDGKEPNPMAQGMSWIKTNVKLAMNDSDATIAELMTDGCDMGIKSLSRYLNQYQAADHKAKTFAKKLIKLEEDLCQDLRTYL